MAERQPQPIAHRDDGSTPPRTAATHAISFDVEEWFHAHNLNIPVRQWTELPSRVALGVDQILCALQHHHTKATFFVLGWVAKRWPRLIRRIHDAGHEIACHGYLHQRVEQLTPQEFRHDIARARALLEDICGAGVVGYRAPGYSITAQTAWTLPILAEEGFVYDSSIYPCRVAKNSRRGLAGFAGLAKPLRLNCGLWELPLPAWEPIRGLRVPALTGGYLRLYPWWMSRCALRQNTARGIPVVVNLHPWEFDENQPRWPASWGKKWRHYLNLSTTASTLDRLLTAAQFTTLSELWSRWADCETTYAAMPAHRVTPSIPPGKTDEAPVVRYAATAPHPDHRDHHQRDSRQHVNH